MTIALRRGNFACEIDPDLGGSILSLREGNRDLLRPTPIGNTDVLKVACFPLIPFANRIRDGRFTFEGRAISLPADPAAPPHAHHGQGWRRLWRTANQTAATATLAFTHEPDDWPWLYEAVQTVALDDAGATVTLTITNKDENPMPAGLGLHPFFLRGPGTTIHITATRMLTNGTDGIPDGETAFEPGPRSVAALEGLDTLLFGGDVGMKIVDDGRLLRLSAKGALGLHCYVPRGDTFFCVEPVTHRPDSFRAALPDERLLPGEHKQVEMRLEAGSTVHRS